MSEYQEIQSRITAHFRMKSPVPYYPIFILVNDSRAVIRKLTDIVTLPLF